MTRGSTVQQADAREEVARLYSSLPAADRERWLAAVAEEVRRRRMVAGGCSSAEVRAGGVLNATLLCLRHLFCASQAALSLSQQRCACCQAARRALISLLAPGCGSIRR